MHQSAFTDHTYPKHFMYNAVYFKLTSRLVGSISALQLHDEMTGLFTCQNQPKIFVYFHFTNLKMKVAEVSLNVYEFMYE